MRVLEAVLGVGGEGVGSQVDERLTQHENCMNSTAPLRVGSKVGDAKCSSIFVYHGSLILGPDREKYGSWSKWSVQNKTPSHDTKHGPCGDSWALGLLRLHVSSTAWECA